MDTWLVEVSLEVIGQEFNHHYEVNTGGVVGIRRANDRYEVVFDSGYTISIPTSQAITVCKEVDYKGYVANMNKLYYERN